MHLKAKLAVGFIAFSCLNVSVAFAASPGSDQMPSEHATYTLATQHMSMGTLAVENHADVNLHPGASELPAVFPFHSELLMNYYTVQSGDSLWKIAQNEGVTVDDLEGWNHLSSSSILHIGQHLIVDASSKSSGRNSSLSSRDASPDASMNAAVVGLEIAKYAEKFVGTPYAWGGTSPSGFDCSGFVYYVFHHFGLDVARTSYDQYGEGSAIKESDLTPGDLVFFDTYGSGASHVAIYVGDGKIIHAASDEVQIDGLDSDYWSSHYIGARRISS